MTLDIEVISFDLDNTLYDYEYSFKIAINEIFNFGDLLDIIKN